MGSGKTNLGKKLAARLKLQFVDLDEEIIRQQRMSISEIFKSKGEAGFRMIERKILIKWFAEDNFIMACGGGTPCFSNNMDRMNAAGQTLFLDLPEEVLLERLIHNQETRPLISGKSEQELKKYIHLMLEERNPFYNKAKISANPVESSLDLLTRILEM